MFGKRIKELREDKGLTQNELGDLLNLTKANISKYENEKLEPNIETIYKLGEIFNVSTDYILGQTDDPRPIDQVNKANQERITQALQGEPPELLDFWKELKEREDLFLLFKQARELDDEGIKRIIRIIKAIEDEEEAGHRYV